MNRLLLWLVRNFTPAATHRPEVGEYVDIGENYLRRYRLGRHVYLHHFIGGDVDRFLHDHPWNAVSLVLRGSYEEELLSTRIEWPRLRKVRWFNRINGETFHRICQVEPDTWTLVFRGNRYKRWGFLETKLSAVKDGSIIMRWKPYA